MATPTSAGRVVEIIVARNRDATLSDDETAAKLTNYMTEHYSDQVVRDALSRLPPSLLLAVKSKLDELLAAGPDVYYGRLGDKPTRAALEHRREVDRQRQVQIREVLSEIPASHPTPGNRSGPAR